MIKRSRSSHRSMIRAVSAARLTLSRFIKDTTGAIVLQTLVFFLFVMGVAGLVIDVGRIYVVNTSAQSYVDQLALAAATELDGKSGARQRARLAAFGKSVDEDEHTDNTLKKMIPFADTSDLFGVKELIFIKELFPDSGFQYKVDDLLGASNSNIATTDAEAEYVIVIAEPSGIATTLLSIARLGSSSDDAVPGTLITSAVAVAGLEDGGICETPMFMFCNPREPSELSSIGSITGRQMILKNHGKKVGGADTSWAPGNYGTIDLPDDAFGACPNSSGNAASRQRCLLGINSLQKSCTTTTVDMDPGQSISIHTGLNLRFGMFDSQTESFRDDANFSPDVNVIKGAEYTPKNNDNKPCYNDQYTDWTESAYLPRSPCLAAGNCASHASGMGYARISPPISVETPSALSTYWGTNHSDHSTFAAAETDASNNYNNTFFPDVIGLGLDTRYEMYLYETYGADSLGNDFLSDVGATSGVQEVGDPNSGTPTCTSAPGLPNRRVMIVASVNCTDEGVSGNSSGVEVDEYFWAFMTEPVKDNSDTTSEDDIYVEFIRQITNKDDPKIIHAYPLLHR